MKILRIWQRFASIFQFASKCFYLMLFTCLSLYCSNASRSKKIVLSKNQWLQNRHRSLGLMRPTGRERPNVRFLLILFQFVFIVRDTIIFSRGARRLLKRFGVSAVSILGSYRPSSFFCGIAHAPKRFARSIHQGANQS